MRLYGLKNTIYKIPLLGRGIRFLWNIAHINRTVTTLQGNTDMRLANMEAQYMQLQKQIEELRSYNENIQAKDLSSQEFHLYTKLNEAEK